MSSKPSIGASSGNINTMLMNQAPSNPTQHDRYNHQKDNLPSKEGTGDRQKRKRDFSKVIDIAHKALNTSQMINYDTNNLNFANENHPNSTQQNSL